MLLCGWRGIWHQPEFWLNLQQQYDPSVVRAERRGQIEREVQALA